MPDFTPGDWWVRRKEHDQGRSVEFWLACDSGEVPMIGFLNANRAPSIAEAEANARLQAAAPKMFAACQAIVGWLDGENDPNETRDGFEVLAEKIELCRAALALARGDQP